MKKKWTGIRATAGLCAALGWRGLLYPELALTPDTVKVSAEDEKGTALSQTSEWSFDSSLYLDLLQADREQITFRSRVFAEIGLLWEAFHGRNGTETK